MRYHELLPENVCIHIASYNAKEHYPIHLYAPEITGLQEGHLLKTTIDYPLNKPVTFKVPYSFNVNETIGKICDKYREIYAEEEVTSKKKAMHLCEEIPGCTLLNRNTTDGVYGIWGHEISDLWIEGLVCDVKEKRLILQIGS